MPAIQAITATRWKALIQGYQCIGACLSNIALVRPHPGDHPFDMGDPRPVESVRVLRLPADQGELILGGNAGRLLGRDREEAVP